MFVTLKIIHFLALLLGGAATIAPGILQRARARAGEDGPPPPAMAIGLRVLGILGLVAILLLWITGLIMTNLGYDGAPLGIWFTIKLIAATVVLGISAALNLAAARAARSGTPPNPALAKSLTPILRGALLLAIVAAAVVFS